MAGLSVQVDARNWQRRMAKLKKVWKPRALLGAIGLRQLAWIDENFKKKGKLVGGWKPLSPYTIRMKGSSAILIRTGRLRQSYAHRVRGSTSVWVGTTVSYAAQHNEGRPNRKPPLPKRRMLPNKQEGTKLAIEVLNGALRKAQRI